MDTNETVYGGCEGPEAKYVKLISSDGHEFFVPMDHALTSGTIRVHKWCPFRVPPTLFLSSYVRFFERVTKILADFLRNKDRWIFSDHFPEIGHHLCSFYKGHVVWPWSICRERNKRSELPRNSIPCIDEIVPVFCLQVLLHGHRQRGSRISYPVRNCYRITYGCKFLGLLKQEEAKAQNKF